MSFPNETEQLKAEIKALEEKLYQLEKLQEPEMTLKKSGDCDMVSYDHKYYYRLSFGVGDYYWYKRYIGSSNLMKVEDPEEHRLVEELYDDTMLDTGGVVEEAQERGERIHKEKEEVLSNLKTSLQELANGDVRPIDDVMEEVKKLQEKTWYIDKRPFMNPNWSPTPYTPEQTETSLKEAMKQAINDGILPSKEELEREAENDIKLKNLLKAMDEYFESNNPPTLKELFEEYLTTKVDWAQSHHVTANELVDIVKEWMPSSHSSNSYDWEKCLKMLRERLR